jgi:LCP family protein required for cell wall assembly
MADFLNLLIIDHTEQTYSILALNRDIMTDIPMMTTDGQVFATMELQLCSAHWYGGDKTMSCENTVTTVSDLLGGLPIDGYYALPMDSISEVNHLVGGVTVTIQDNDLAVLDPAFAEGATLTLTDEQAYNFVHVRMGVGTGENPDRMERQKQYLDALLEQAKAQMATEPDLALAIFDELADYATTDLSGKILSKLCNRAAQYENRGTFQFEGTNQLGDTLGDGIEHYEFYLDDGSILRVLTGLFALEPVEE